MQTMQQNQQTSTSQKCPEDHKLQGMVRHVLLHAETKFRIQTFFAFKHSPASANTGKGGRTMPHYECMCNGEHSAPPECG